MPFHKELPKELNKLQQVKLHAYPGYIETDSGISWQYQCAVDILVSQIIEQEVKVDFISNPLLYLMRHSIELELKSNIKYLKQYSTLEDTHHLNTHSINNLLVEFVRHYESAGEFFGFNNSYNIEYSFFKENIEELVDKLGTDWSSFRYTDSGDKKKVTKKLFESDEMIDIYKIKSIYDESTFFFSHIEEIVGHYEKLKGKKPVA